MGLGNVSDTIRVDFKCLPRAQVSEAPILYWYACGFLVRVDDLGILSKEAKSQTYPCNRSSDAQTLLTFPPSLISTGVEGHAAGHDPASCRGRRYHTGRGRGWLGVDQVVLKG